MTTAALALMQARGSPHAAQEADDEALVRRFLRWRDPEVFGVLVRRHQEPLFRLVAATLGPGAEAEAEDCVQEVFIQVFHRLSGFRFRSRFSTWLYRIARNKAIDYKRRPCHRYPHLDERALQLHPSPVALPETDAAKREEAATVRALVSELGEPQRTVVHLFYWLDTSVSEIAHLLGMRPGTVKSHLHRARNRLARDLQGRP